MLSNTFTIDLNSYSGGVYFIHLVNDDEVIVKKIIKE